MTLAINQTRSSLLLMIHPTETTFCPSLSTATAVDAIVLSPLRFPRETIANPTHFGTNRPLRIYRAGLRFMLKRILIRIVDSFKPSAGQFDKGSISQSASNFLDSESTLLSQ